MVLKISSWRDLRAHEASILAAVSKARFGAQLFLVDPVRFLRESGCVVGEVFARELDALPAVQVAPAGTYDAIVAGDHPSCQQAIRISGLGLPSGLGEPAAHPKATAR